ncbi:hypothetical protein N431DRAFT_222808 [Stipitochalara longipes BDJ]|nr:hypothetical protein N431DRAFT_222808 [Stipitochalara longipes BDJ]
MVKYSQSAIFWWIARSCLASSCPSTGGINLSCPSNDPNGSFCSGESLSTSIIVNCEGGCPSPGNCNDHLAQIAISGGALCYQDSPTAGNAQCTYDCVSVKALNGSTLYPMLFL